jgi:branched-chain amino acid transport system ATP-binding protein
MTTLTLRNLYASYDGISALRGISLQVSSGEIVALVGSNGAGKSTTLKAISGLIEKVSGEILLDGTDLMRVPPHGRVARGIAHAPEGRQVFAPLSVEDNIRLGAIRRGGEAIEATLDEVYTLFPDLRAKRRELAGTLSGGQQQMLAIARAMAARPLVLLLDEPSMGISPVLAKQIFRAISKLRDDGIAVLLVEQNAWGALQVADRVYVMEAGEIVQQGQAEALRNDPALQAAYLGG